MRNCPVCGTQYSDDTLLFCLQDGTRLIDVSETGPPIRAIEDTELVTSVRLGGQASDPRFMESQVTRVGTLGVSGPVSRTGRTALAVGLTAVVMLVLFAFIGIVAYFAFRTTGNTDTGNVPNKNTDLSNLVVKTSPSPSLSASPSATRIPSTPPPPAETPISTPTPRVLANYPGTTRLKFGRGSYSTSFAGEVNPGDNRSLVLACRSGQSLSATVSGGGCITFRGGGTSLRFATSSGDNYLTVTNTCQQVTRFTVTISVI